MTEQPVVGRWRVMAHRFGRNANGDRVTRGAGRTEVDVLAGTLVAVYPERDHGPIGAEDGPAARYVVGFIERAWLGWRGIVADLALTDATFDRTLLQRWQRGATSGLSHHIHILGAHDARTGDRVPLIVQRVVSVDVVLAPAGGGRFLWRHGLPLRAHVAVWFRRLRAALSLPDLGLEYRVRQIQQLGRVPGPEDLAAMGFVVRGPGRDQDARTERETLVANALAACGLVRSDVRRAAVVEGGVRLLTTWGAVVRWAPGMDVDPLRIHECCHACGKWKGTETHPIIGRQADARDREPTFWRRTQSPEGNPMEITTQSAPTTDPIEAFLAAHPPSRPEDFAFLAVVGNEVKWVTQAGRKGRWLIGAPGQSLTEFQLGRQWLCAEGHSNAVPPPGVTARRQCGRCAGAKGSDVKARGRSRKYLDEFEQALAAEPR